MAELAAGAVHSLLAVIRNEAQLLRRVESDVQFIKEEMESMNSFLLHLARTTPPGGEHGEQVRTWMKQVRDLAYACSNSIDLYLYRGDPAIHRARGPLGYVWWVPWYLKKLVAQHSAASQLRELKARARDVGERRLRYGVEIPKSGDTTTSTVAPITRATSWSQATGEGDIEEDDIPLKVDDDSMRRALKIDDSKKRALALSEPRILEECSQELVDWLNSTKKLHDDSLSYADDKFPAIAVAAPNEEDGAGIAREALAHSSVATKFEHKFWITFQEWTLAEPLYILEAIMKELLIPETHGYELAKTLEDKIGKINEKIKEHLDAGRTIKSRVVVPLEPLDLLHGIFPQIGESSKKDQNCATGKWGGEDDDQMDKKIEETAKKIKEHMEMESRSWTVGLDHPEYVGILQKLLPEPTEDKPPIKEATDNKSGDDDQISKNIKEIMNKIKGDILREVLPKSQEDRSADKSAEDQIAENIKETTERIIVNMLREQLLKPKEADRPVKKATDKLGEEDHMSDKKIEQITERINGALQNIKEQLLIKEISKKIKEHLADKRTLIVLHGINYTYKWREIKRALSELGCAAGSAAIVTTKYSQGSEEFCNPARQPILYSLVGFYHRKVVLLTGQRKYKDVNYNTNIFRAILGRCEPHEFCMKIFVRALYANPNRNNEELHKLLDALVWESSLDLDTNAKIMLKFSYNDLPRDYKTCLLYLAIFPRGHKINRSRLVGRWVVEGLVTKEDWPSSMRQAERCFDALVDRWLVYPGDIGAAGKVKSCIVHDIVHEFITKKARKEHITDTRLSHHLARHFSVLSDLRLRSSDNIEKFLRKLYKSPQLPLVKVLDLEGCQHFAKDQHCHYLKTICDKMLLLKYLSLRNTGIIMLPKEINNLHQLEVLDIRQTHVTAPATRDVLLLKLKRLLAGHIDYPSPISTDTGSIRVEKSSCSVRIPHRIEKMINMEVLSNIEASGAGDDLKDIGKLWQLRKFGVVIKDKKGHLKNLLRVIGDLNECLQSLSITLPTKREGAPSIGDLPKDICGRLTKPPKLLESLSISGITRRGQLLPLLVKGHNLLAKITLCYTSLNQDNLRDLAKLPKLCCVRLRHKAYTESKLTFKTDEFQNLKYLLVEGSNMTDISFENGAAPQLEKIVLSFTYIKSLCGVDHLPELKELELNGNGSPLSLFDNANQITKVTLRGTLLKQDDLQILAKKPNMRCLLLLDKSCDESQLTFNKDEFQKVNLLIVECSVITNISFTDGAAPKLEKMVWSFTNMDSLSGIGELPKLKELEFNGENVPNQVMTDIEAHPNGPVSKHNKSQNEDQAKGSTAEADDASCFPFFWKNKDRC